MATPPLRPGQEWIGGLVSRSPDDDAPYEVLVWIIGGGPVAGYSKGKPGELLATAARSLRNALRRKEHGGPHSPLRVRVATPELASVLRAGLPRRIEVVCAPTPELRWALDVIKMNDSEVDESFMAYGVEAARVASFFSATAALFRARPWSVAPTDASFVSVTIESLGVARAALSLFERKGQRGFRLLSGCANVEEYRDAVLAMRGGERSGPWPEVLSLRFERGGDLSAALRREVAEHRWDLAGEDAYPRLGTETRDDDDERAPPTEDELAIAEAVARALLVVLAEPLALVAAWRGGAPIARTLRVKTSAGEVEVALRVPYPSKVRRKYGPPYNVMAHLAQLVLPKDHDDDEEADHTWVALNDELHVRFSESPEGRAVHADASSHLVASVAADRLRVTLATLSAPQLRTILFEIIPREHRLDATKTQALVEETRALYRFLKRAFALPQADACLQALDDDRGLRLEAMRLRGQSTSR